MAPRFLGWRAGLPDALPGAENFLLPQISPRSPAQTGESFFGHKAIWSDEVDELRCSDGFKCHHWRRECQDELGRLRQPEPPRQPPKERRGKRPSPYLPLLATTISPLATQKAKDSEGAQMAATVHYGDQLICRGDLGAFAIERQQQQEQRGRQRLQVDLEAGMKQRQLAVEWRQSRDRQAASATKIVSARVVSTTPGPPPAAPEVSQDDEDDVSDKVRSRLEKLRTLTKSSVLLGKGLTHQRDQKLRAKVRNCVLNGVQNKHQNSRKVMKDWERRRRKTAKLPSQEKEVLAEAFALFASGQGQGGIAATDLVRCLAELGLEGENSDERQPIKEMCAQMALAFHEDLECVTSIRASHPRSYLCLKPSPEHGEDGNHEGSWVSSKEKPEQPQEGSDELELDSEVSPVCLEDFCIEVLPAARLLLAEARYDTHFTEFVEACGAGGVSLDADGFKRLADRLYIDAKLVHEALQGVQGSSTARLSELSGISPAGSEPRRSPSPTKKAPAKGGTKHAAAHSAEPTLVIEFDAAHELVLTLREKTQRQCRRQEREIRHKTRMPDDLFWQYRSDLIRFFELFSTYDLDKTLNLSPGEFKQLLKVIGLQPYSDRMAVFVDKIIMESDENGDEQIDFNEFVSLMNKVREHQKARRRNTFVQRFRHYDKDGSGQLSLKDMELLFRDVGCQANNREQQEILRQLIEKFDAGAGGDVTFQQLEDLCQRATESLFRFVNEQHAKEAEALGCSRDKFAEYQWAFDQLDCDGSGSLSRTEVEQVLRMLMVRPPSAQELQTLYEEIDKSNDGELDFKDFLSLMKVASNARGMFAQELPLTLRDVPERSLRDCLKAFALSDSYVRDLPAPELPALVGGYIGARPNDNLREDLPQSIGNVRQLVDFARQRARSMGILGGVQLSQKKKATVRVDKDRSQI